MNLIQWWKRKQQLKRQWAELERQAEILDQQRLQKEYAKFTDTLSKEDKDKL